MSELEVQLLEKIDLLRQEIEVVKQRTQKLEDNSAWNILLEEAGKLNITPEQLLKRAITQYAKKQRSG